MVRGADHDLSVVVVAHNRCRQLLRTLEALHAREPAASADIIVVDNASTDDTAAQVARRFPAVRLVRNAHNTGVAAFNTGLAHARDGQVLILDDDAHPDPDALALALLLLEERPDVAAVALHPRHPSGGVSEWPAARRCERASNAWPLMGCGNLVRRHLWHAAGGYCEDFFLYRNDTDLALSFAGLGYGVWFDPSWVVWHDSPAAATKSPRWCQLATRNWLWMARRHGRGAAGVTGIALGLTRALAEAAPSPTKLLALARGAASGLVTLPPPPAAPSPRAWRTLIALRLGGRAPSCPRYLGPCTPQAPAPTTPDTPRPSRRGTSPTASST